MDADARAWRRIFDRNKLNFKGNQMSKGDKRRGNREAKKQKKAKEKVVATADFNKGKAPLNVGNKKTT